MDMGAQGVLAQGSLALLIELWSHSKCVKGNGLLAFKRKRKMENIPAQHMSVFKHSLAFKNIFGI